MRSMTPWRERQLSLIILKLHKLRLPTLTLRRPRRPMGTLLLSLLTGMLRRRLFTDTPRLFLSTGTQRLGLPMGTLYVLL